MKINLKDKVNKKWLHPTGKPVVKKLDRKKIANQIASSDYPSLYEGMDIDMDKLGCIMLDTEKIPVAQYVKEPNDDLFVKEGWGGGLASEESPHVTLLFGLLENGNIWKDKVDSLLEGWECPTVTIDMVSYFDLGDSYAVIALVEQAADIVDGHERLTLLPHINTFSEYHPHITLAYLKKEADVHKWVKALNKIYEGQKVVTKGINYGDLPEDDANDNSLEAKQAILSPPEAPTSHDCTKHEFVPNTTQLKATNALDPSLKDAVILQESNLQQAVARLEGEIVQAVIEAVRRGDIAEAEEIIAEAQEESFVVELAAIMVAFYTVLFPIYAAQLLAARLATFGAQGYFAMTEEVKIYIQESARKAAESHVSTIIKDLSKTVNTASDTAIKKELIRLIEEKAQAQVPETVALLPANPNREDITRAIDSGKFDNDPAYKRARELARQGQGLDEIIRAIQREYSHISQTRAKTIARHESSRVFNMSQYQADLQFLTESGYMNRAYKRLRSRTGTPCPVCKLLIEQTTANPIPFATNFADLGTELTASYKKDNGKMGVQKIPISYEAIKAGNVHVSCVMPDTVIQTDNIKDMVRSYYSGDIVNLLTANGRRLGVTPNHIMLTSRGWVAAKNIRQGDSVVAHLDSAKVAKSPTDNNSPTTIEEQFTFIVKSLNTNVLSVPASPEYLKGDAIFSKGEINIIPIKSHLRGEVDSSLGKFLLDQKLVSTLPQVGVTLVEKGNLFSMLVALGLVADGIMSIDSFSSLFDGAKPTNKQLISLSDASNYNSRISKSIGDSPPVNTKTIRDAIKRLSSFVKLDKVVGVDIVPYSGHVYDISSVSTLYIANSIITSNCNCEYELIVKNEDGTIMNNIDVRVENGLGYNPYRDKDGKFDTGPSTGVFGSNLEDLEPKAIEDFVQNHPTKFTKEDAEAVEFYAGPDASYEAINDYFRRGNGQLDDIVHNMDGGSKNMGEITEHLDLMTVNNKAEKDFISYRIFKVKNDNINKYSRNFSFRDKGYVSTTLDLEHLKTFEEDPAGDETLVTMRITIKNGDKGVFVDNLLGFPNESEFLMPRDRIFAVKKRQRGKGRLFMDVVVAN